MVENIQEETQREAIINRPHNLAGAVKYIAKDRFNIYSDKIIFGKARTVQALLKLFQETLDNSVDIYIKSKGKFSNKIDVKVNNTTIKVKDNGYGISSSKNDVGEHIIYVATCKYNTSSNYGDNRGGDAKGVNGIGIKLCSTLSTTFRATSDDGKKITQVVATENNLNHKVTTKKTTGVPYTELEFSPDMNLFDTTEIDEHHIRMMYEYTLIQSLTYPEIEFKFNSKKVSYTPKKFLSLFNKPFIAHEDEDFFIAVMPNDTDDFKQISYVNGLETHKGGSHINFINSQIISKVREKIAKKHPNIKVGDIKNKITLVFIAKGFKNLDWDGQTKESIINPDKDFREYFKDTKLDWEVFANKIVKSKDIIDPITEIYRIKEEFAKRKELEGLDKKKKKIKSEKYFSATGIKKRLFLVEGESALGSLLPGLGRKENGIYVLKGKPLNAYDQPQTKFTNNKELSELYTIIKNEGYDEVYTATDADLDGQHIIGLLLGFVYRYTPELLENKKFGIFKTPMMGLKKSNKLVKWFYTPEEFHVFEENNNINSYTVKYYKGLGSLRTEDYKEFLKAGIDKSLHLLNLDNTDLLDSWLNSKRSDDRKEMLKLNTFSIIKL